MSIEQQMIDEDLARDEADKKQAEYEQEHASQVESIADGDIREILREWMAEADDGAFDAFIQARQFGWEGTEKEELYKIFCKCADEYVTHNMRDGR